MPTIVHFDISANNIDTVREFYEKMFGWKISAIEGFSDYYEIETSDLQNCKGIGGGITLREPLQQTGITQYIGVSSIDKSIADVTILGGKVLQPKMAVPGYGYTALGADPENNVFGLFEDDQNAGAH